MKNSTLNLLSILCGTMLFSIACDAPDAPAPTTLDTLSIATLAPLTVNPVHRPTPSASNDLQASLATSLSMECDAYLQDCPEGQKCAPIIDDGGSAWNANKCVPVTGMDQPDEPGEPCHTDDIASGIDSCIEGAMCWNVDMDGNGTCVAQCTGTPDAPSCDPGKYGPLPCTIANDGVLNLCIPDCNPLGDDCAANEMCATYNESFTCAPDASADEGQAFDDCAFINQCDTGLMCVQSGLAPECNPGSEGCCMPFCDTSLANTCPGQGQECLPFFEPWQIPPTLPGDEPSFKATLGICLQPW